MTLVYMRIFNLRILRSYFNPPLLLNVDIQGVDDRAKCPFKKDIVEKYLVLDGWQGPGFGASTQTSNWNSVTQAL